MARPSVPTPAEARALLGRGSGRNFAATSPAAADSRFRPRVLPLAVEPAISARSGARIGRGDLGQNRRNLAELWRALGVAE